MQIINKSNVNSREYDIRELEDELRKTRDPQHARDIKRSIERIRSEYHNKPLRDMREALIKAHRNGEVDNVKDIHHFINGKQKYQNDR